MKKYYLIGILAILLVISVSGCIGDNNSNNGNSTRVQSVTQNGVILEFPQIGCKQKLKIMLLFSQ